MFFARAACFGYKPNGLAETTLCMAKYSGLLYFTWKWRRNLPEVWCSEVSMLAARMQKMKANNLAGIERHNKRIYQNHSNEDIDDSLSYLNYDLVHQEGKYKDIVQEIIDSQKEGNRAIRKDAVLVNERQKALFRRKKP